MEKTRVLRDFRATQDIAGNLTLILLFENGTAAGVLVSKKLRRTLAYLIDIDPLTVK